MSSSPPVNSSPPPGSSNDEDAEIRGRSSELTERAFLHAISTPLATLGLMIESLLESPGQISPSQIAGLRKMHELSGRVFEMIRERRSRIP